MVRRILIPNENPLFWMGSSKRDLLAFPEEVKDAMGIALSVAQFGGKHPGAKPWHGEGPGVFEIAEDFRGNTYRAVYTVRFSSAVYVLHSFQKKSPRGSRTARTDIATVRSRLRAAQEDYENRFGSQRR